MIQTKAGIMTTTPRTTSPRSDRHHRSSWSRRGRVLLTCAAVLAPSIAASVAVTSPAAASVPTIDVYVGDASVVEGDGLPNGTANLAVELSAPAATDTYIWFHTVDGSASAGDGDYARKKPGKANLKIAAGRTAGTIGVTVYGDTAVEGDESFTVVLDQVTTTPTGSADPDYDLARNVGTATIVDDDPATASLSVGAVAVPEGNTAKRLANLGLRLSEPLATDEYVYFYTEGESATSGHDFSAMSPRSKVRIPAGKVLGLISTTVLPDTDNEGDETYRVVIDKVTPTVGGSQDPAVTVTDAIGEVTIINDDVPRTAPGAPTSVHATFNGYGGGVDVTWTAPASTGGRPVSYLVERSNDFGGTWAPIASVSTTSTNVTCGFEGDHCIFRVSAHNSIGDSVTTDQIEGPLWNCFSSTCIV